MSVYSKLNEARAKFHALKLEKSGLNKFAGYKYFELADFLIPALRIFNEVGLCAFVSFDEKIATMTIVDVAAPGGSPEKIVITSPLSEANLKGCHPIQNVGACETYSRRYLWTAALEILEHDALDATSGKTPAPVIAATPPTESLNISTARMTLISRVAKAVVDHHANDDIVGAFQEYEGITESEETIALWKLLPSNVRSAIKRHGESLKVTA